MKFLSLFSGGGGFDLGLEQAGFECVGQVEIMPYALKILKKHWPKVPKHTNISTLFASDSHVKTFQSLIANRRDYQAPAADSFSKLCELSTWLFQNGYSLRMFPDSFRLTEGGTLQLSCGSWPKAGMGINGEFWTVNSSESLNNVVVCSLSDALEVNVPPKYYLSKKAVLGIIRRTEKWSRSGYVFLQETEKDKTRAVKILSLQSLKHLITTVNPSDNSETKTISSPIQSTPISAGSVEGYGSRIILRKLTPTEKERLQGFPINFTKIEE